MIGENIFFSFFHNIDQQISNQNCQAGTSPEKQMDKVVFLFNLNLDFKFQVFPDRQDRKTN